MGAAKQTRSGRGSKPPIAYKKSASGFTPGDIDTSNVGWKRQLKELVGKSGIGSQKPVKHKYLCFERNYVTAIFLKGTIEQLFIESEKEYTIGQVLIGKTCDWEVFAYGKVRAVDKKA